MNFCHKKELQSQDQLQSKNIASSLPPCSQRLRFLFYTTEKNHGEGNLPQPCIICPLIVIPPLLIPVRPTQAIYYMIQHVTLQQDTAHWMRAMEGITFLSTCRGSWIARQSSYCWIFPFKHDT